MSSPLIVGGGRVIARPSTPVIGSGSCANAPLIVGGSHGMMSHDSLNEAEVDLQRQDSQHARSRIFPQVKLNCKYCVVVIF